MASNLPMARAAGSGRVPLYDVTNRLNSESLQHLHDQIKRRSYRAPEIAAILGEGQVSAVERDAALRRATVATSARHGRDEPVYYHSTSEEAAAAAAELEGGPANGQGTDGAFNSRSPQGYKTHIGPWQLGKDLGKGSTGMVRLCRHRVTHELAAVKIVSKNSSRIVQAGSIYALDRWDKTLPERVNGEMRIPMAIEREVAILKLTQHPNIMKLYDIWENRKEIYLVLEYVDNGDLFTYITRNGRLSEEGAMHFFRQIMGAISYCHAFNICHRDLKPENILLTSDNQVKIADFSMAAIHQTRGHRLRTACGSPHYAAPELLSGHRYMGDKADIWSMGVILYAMLAECLPFDDPDLTLMMEMVKLGEYDMPEFLGLEAKDLIRRILQINPDRRISMKEMRRHPLVQKYDCMDDYQPENKQPTDIRKEFKHRPFRADEIDSQLLRQLRSLWHMFSEDELKVALMSREENEQKVFYWLLQKYRERQLENFNPEIAHSRSDYHHLKPSGLKERRRTCEFTNTEGRFGKSVSRFTVISRVEETDEAEGTDWSYDPYNSNNAPPKTQGDTAKSTVCKRNNRARRVTMPASQTSRANRASTRSAQDLARARVKSSQSNRLASIQGTASSLSTATSGRSRQGAPYVRNAKVRRRRGVDFSQARSHHSEAKAEARDRLTPLWDVRGGAIYLEKSPGVPRPDSGVLPLAGTRVSNKAIKKKPATPSVSKTREREVISGEELRNFSSSLAKDCDEAFGSLLGDGPSVGPASMLDMGQQSRDQSPLTLGFGSSPLQSHVSHPSPLSDCEQWLDRPLPPPPLVTGLPSPPPPRPVSKGKDVCQEAPKVSMEKEVKHHGKISTQLHRLSMHSKVDRRIASAPAETSKENKSASQHSVVSWKRSGIIGLDDQDRSRIVSAPSGSTRPSSQGQKTLGRLSNAGNTMRVMDSPKNSQENPFTGRENVHVEDVSQVQTDSQKHKKTEGAASQMSAASGVMKSVKKKSSWFTGRSSDNPANNASGVQSTENLVEPHAQEKGQAMASHTTPVPVPQSHSSGSTAVHSPAPAKKKKFGLLFWKSAKPDTKMSIAGPDYEDSPALTPKTEDDNNGRHSRLSMTDDAAVAQRNISIHHNWLARLFRVKPFTSHLCLTISRKRARQEVTLVLRQWRKYGVRDIQVDRRRNIIFARVAARNYLGMKEVAFAVEVMTVIEHGRKEPLSIVRFTQERGAASTLQRVVGTMREAFEAQRLLVADRQKAKMMVKTLDS